MEDIRAKLKEKYGYESVFVLHAGDINPLLAEGYNPFDKSILNRITQKGFFIRRYNAEYNPKFRQIVPYVVLRHGNTLFASRRLKGAGESRLIGNISLGQSGHCNPVDNLFGNLITNCVVRELHEELDVYCNIKGSAKFIGFLNDNSNEVSQDHIAVLVIIDVSKPNITIKEKEKAEGDWVTMEWLKENYHLMESWSQKVFDVLEGSKG